MKQLLVLFFFGIYFTVFSQEENIVKFSSDEGFLSKDIYTVIQTPNSKSNPIWLIKANRKSKQTAIYSLDDSLQIKTKYEFGKFFKISKNVSLVQSYFYENKLFLYLLSNDESLKKIYSYQVVCFNFDTLEMKLNSSDIQNVSGRILVGVYPFENGFVKVSVDKENQLYRVFYNELSYVQKTEKIPFDLKLGSTLKRPKTSFIQNDQTFLTTNANTSKIYTNYEQLQLSISGKYGVYVFQEEKGDLYTKKFFKIEKDDLSKINSLIHSNQYIFIVEYLETHLLLHIFDLKTEKLLASQEITKENYKNFVVGDLQLKKSLLGDETIKLYDDFSKFARKVYYLKPSIEISPTDNEKVLQLTIGGVGEKMSAASYILSGIGTGVGISTGGTFGMYASLMVNNQATMNVFFNKNTLKFEHDLKPKDSYKEVKAYIKSLEKLNKEEVKVKNIGISRNKKNNYIYHYSIDNKEFIIRKF